MIIVSRNLWRLVQVQAIFNNDFYYVRKSKKAFLNLKKDRAKRAFKNLMLFGHFIQINHTIRMRVRNDNLGQAYILG